MLLAFQTKSVKLDPSTVLR